MDHTFTADDLHLIGVASHDYDHCLVIRAFNKDGQGLKKIHKKIVLHLLTLEHLFLSRQRVETSYNS